MKPVYKINRIFLKFPSKCYSGTIMRMLGILSPSCCVRAWCGDYGEQVAAAYGRCRREHVKAAVNKRTASKSDYEALRRYERRRQKKMQTAEKWKQAEGYLNMLIAEYTGIGWTGQFGLQLTLLPLKRRLDAGERTEALYTEIMQCE